MAGDWLKVEKDTPAKPEILAIAASLSLDPEVVFARCFKVWCWADSHTQDGHVENVTPLLLDSLIHTPGFSQALLDVGWLVARSGSLQFPHFARHMGQSAKKRLDASDRQRKSRLKRKGKDVTTLSQESVTKALPEKRREEKSKYPPSPLLGEKTEGVGKEESKPSHIAIAERINYPPPEQRAAFDRFWAAYPNKVAQPDAWREWLTIDPGPELVEAILAAVREQCGSERWQREDGRYIPEPANWLVKKRWNDQPPKAPAPPPRRKKPLLFSGPPPMPEPIIRPPADEGDVF